MTQSFAPSSYTGEVIVALLQSTVGNGRKYLDAGLEQTQCFLNSVSLK